MFDIANNTEFLTAIGIADAQEETKAKIAADIEDLVKERLVTKLSDRLTEAQAEEFGAITDEKQAYDWLMTNVPDFNDIVTGVLQEVRDDILAHKAAVIW